MSSGRKMSDRNCKKDGPRGRLGPHFLGGPFHHGPDRYGRISEPAGSRRAALRSALIAIGVCNRPGRFPYRKCATSPMETSSDKESRAH
jgi:hypothetical protein